MNANDAGPHTSGPNWPIAHPWWWMGFAFVATASAFAWARLAPDGHHPLESVQVPLLALGVLAGAVAVILRLNGQSLASAAASCLLWRSRMLHWRSA
jgi:hypothetical protein